MNPVFLNPRPRADQAMVMVFGGWPHLVTGNKARRMTEAEVAEAYGADR